MVRALDAVPAASVGLARALALVHAVVVEPVVEVFGGAAAARSSTGLTASACVGDVTSDTDGTATGTGAAKKRRRGG